LLNRFSNSRPGGSSLRARLAEALCGEGDAARFSQTDVISRQLSFLELTHKFTAFSLLLPTA
jgi:hypothetical protein